MSYFYTLQCWVISLIGVHLEKKDLIGLIISTKPVTFLDPQITAAFFLVLMGV